MDDERLSPLDPTVHEMLFGDDTRSLVEMCLYEPFRWAPRRKRAGQPAPQVQSRASYESFQAGMEALYGDLD